MTGIVSVDVLRQLTSPMLLIVAFMAFSNHGVEAFAHWKRIGDTVVSRAAFTSLDAGPSSLGGVSTATPTWEEKNFDYTFFMQSYRKVSQGSESEAKPGTNVETLRWGVPPAQLADGRGVQSIKSPPSNTPTADDVVQNVPTRPFLVRLAAAESHFAPELAKAVAIRVVSAKVSWLSVVALLALVLKLNLRQRPEAEKAPCSRELEPVAEMQDGTRLKDLGQGVDGKLVDLQEESSQVSEIPPPMRRLRHIGASYVIPRARILGCSTDYLSFDIPTLPCVWPLRAVLMRPTQQGAWTQLQLTVDIIAASGLPPLLTCERTGSVPLLADCGGTGDNGGTGGTRSPSEAAADVEEEVVDAVTEEEQGINGYRPWLKISNAGCTVVATILRQQDGSCVVQRQDRSVWDLNMHLDVDSPRITVSKQGEEIGQSTSLGHGREEHLQVDTQPDVQSPESALLLMCMLVMLAFRP